MAAPGAPPTYAPPPQAQQPPPAQPPQQLQPGEAEASLNFDFQSIPDVRMPPDPGWRQFIIKKPPNLKQSTDPQKAGEVNFIAVCHINEPGKRDHDEVIVLMLDVNDRQDQFMIKQLYYAVGIDPVAGIKTNVLVNRPFQARVDQANGKRKDGSVAVFSNIREFMVDQRFIRNVPSASAPSQPAPPIAQAPPQVVPMQLTPPAPPAAYAPPTYAPPPAAAPPPPPQPQYAAPPPPPAVPQQFAPPPPVQYAPPPPPPGLPNPPPIPGQ